MIAFVLKNKIMKNINKDSINSSSSQIKSIVVENVIKFFY